MKESIVVFPSSQKATIIVLVALFLWTFGGVGDASALYQDESDKLPGDTDNTFLYIIGAAVVVGIIYMLVKPSGDDKKSDNDDSALLDDEDSATTLASDGNETFCQIGSLKYRAENAGSQVTGPIKLPIDPFIYIQKERMGVGLLVSF